MSTNQLSSEAKKLLAKMAKRADKAILRKLNSPVMSILY